MATGSFLSLCTIALLVVGLAFYISNRTNLHHFFNLLLILTTVQLLQADIIPENEGILITGIIGSLTGINFLAGSFMKASKWRWSVPVLTIILILFTGKNELMYGNYSLNFSDVKVTGIIVLGFLIGAISCLIQFLLKKFFSESSENNIQLAAQLVLTGLFVIPATFFVSWYGFLLLAVGTFLYDSFSVKKNSSIVLSLLGFAAISPFLSLYGIESVDLSIGKTIAGLIVGAGAYSLGILATKSSNKLLGVALLFLGISAVGLITLLNNVHPAYGGTESFIAALTGMAIASLFSGKTVVGSILFPAFLAIGLLMPSDPFAGSESVNQGEESSTLKASTAQQSEEESKGLDISGLSGSYTIVPETAAISFQLGPKGGITKGAIKEFEGTVDFGNDVHSAKFNVKLPTKKLTTFNSMRDESVMGSGYLNEPKFPLMSFSSSKVEVRDDGYLLKGNFSLLGKTNSEDVFIKYLGEKEGKQQFTGKGSIDRTKYGMPSSPQEGNVVDFTFTFELK